MTAMVTAMMTLAQAHALLRPLLPDAALIGDGNVAITRVHSDTRSLQAGDLFVALKGERFDGHDMLAQARTAGAVAAIAERGFTEAMLPGLMVSNTQTALEKLAHAWRLQHHLPLIAITGSNGKTTVTQMVHAILRAWVGEGAFATQGNFNNHIGLPLTLLRLRHDETTHHRAGVVELGMNHVGEIAHLAAIAQPTIALVNNAQREHQEFMVTVEAVARENGAVFAALPASGTAVFPADDAYTPLWHTLAGARPTVTFALDAAADVSGAALWNNAQGAWNITATTPAGALSFALRQAGAHNAKNALAAAACALAAGAPLEAIAKGLESFEPVKGRSQLKQALLHGERITLIDDSYNANPDSVRAAIDVLTTLPAPQWLVLGDMGEVGDQGPAFHAEVGRYAKERGIAHLWCAGALAAHTAQTFGPNAQHFADTPTLISALHLSPAAKAVLVKGSRFMAMERIVAELTK
jgi:UDP-N-acetylmuramoyl-tripeptide--D-alanyl-D-alanine ligase